MKIKFHKNFEKKYKKLPTKLRSKVKDRNRIFSEDPFDPVLNNHALQGRYRGYRSINITGDIRVVYRFLDKNKALFVDIDSHSNLYR
ncbi:MAG: type II toxin-antitoxin system YafQ family toxin [Candidatus Paceibacterota bacterium]